MQVKNSNISHDITHFCMESFKGQLRPTCVDRHQRKRQRPDAAGQRRQQARNPMRR